MCEKKSHLHNQWLQEVYYAQKYSKEQKSKALTYPRHNFMEIIRDDDFLQLDIENLIELLRPDDLNVDSEVTVFESVKRWIDYNCKSQSEVLSKLFTVIRLPMLPINYLIDNVIPYAWNSPGCERYIREALHWNIDEVCETKSKRTEFRWPLRNLVAISTNIVEVYDVDENKWNRLNNMDLNKDSYSAAMMNDRLIICGGELNKSSLDTVEEVNLLNGKVTSLACMNEQRQSHRLIAFGHGKYATVFAIGGTTSNDFGGKNTVEKYIPSMNKWVYVSPMISKRYGFGADIHNHKIYVIGGYGDGKFQTNVEVYDVYKDKWEEKSCMKQQRIYNNAVCVGDLLYVMAGNSWSYSEESLLTSVECYNTVTDTWTTIANLSTSGYIGATLLGNSPVAVGGWGSDTVEVYDSNKNEWKKLAHLNVKRDIVHVFPLTFKMNDCKFQLYKAD